LFGPWLLFIVEDKAVLILGTIIPTLLGEVLLIPENRFDVCQFCGKKFEREETLAVHVSEEHDDLIGGNDGELQ
jgi:hypothetical protein